MPNASTIVASIPGELGRRDEVAGKIDSGGAVGSVEPVDSEQVRGVRVVRTDGRKPRGDRLGSERGVGELRERRERDARVAEASDRAIAGCGVDDLGLETEGGHRVDAADSSTRSDASARTCDAGMLMSRATSRFTISVFPSPAARNITDLARLTAGTVRVIRTRPR